jgi:hypothetical protein
MVDRISEGGGEFGMGGGVRRPGLEVPGMAVNVVGLSLRLPQSTSATQFWNHLINGRDMVTESRWPGLYGAPLRGGIVSDFTDFDAPFFAVHGKQNQVHLIHCLWYYIGTYLALSPKLP